MSTPATAPSASGTDLVKGLSLFDATTIVMGSMIGSGIFIVSAEIGREVGSPGLMLLSWIISGVMTVIAAVSYAELAAMMPRAGGQYVFLRESLGPLSGFLYGWTLFLVIQTGTLAAVAVAFGKFLGLMVPWVSEQNLLVNAGTIHLFGHAVALSFSTEQFIAILVLLGLAAVNYFGLRSGALVQNVFTVLKVGTLVGILGVGLWWVSSGHPSANAAVHNYWQGAHWNLATLTILSVALVGPLFASITWEDVTFTGSEIINAARNLPLALLIGTVVVCALYYFCNVAYLQVLPFYGVAHGAGPLARGIQHAAEDRVGTAVMQVAFGAKGAVIMAAAIVISTFGCMNGLTLAGARVYYAMAKDGLFFPSVARVNKRYHTPAVSLAVQAVWASLLTLSGTYNQLLDYVIFAVVLFYALTIIGLFRLRRTQPDAPRPYRAWGYPVLPGIYVIFAAFVEWALLTHKAVRSAAGLGIVALGIPVYYLWRRRAKTQHKPSLV